MHRTAEIDGDHAVDEVRCVLHEGLDVAPASTVHQYVDTRIFLEHLGGTGADRIRIPEIDGDEIDLLVSGGGVFLQCLTSGGVDIGANHGGTFASKCQYGRLADARGTSSDQHYLAVKFHRGAPLFVGVEDSAAPATNAVTRFCVSGLVRSDRVNSSSSV